MDQADMHPLYDVVRAGARVCDPASGLDRICEVAVRGHRIAALGPDLAAQARAVIDVGRARDVLALDSQPRRARSSTAPAAW